MRAGQCWWRQALLLLGWLAFFTPWAVASPLSQGELAERWQDVVASGDFDLPGLRVALDYARILHQIEQRERAETVIEVALEGVDLDRNRRRESILAEGWPALGSEPFDQRRFLADARDLLGPRIGEGLPRRGKALRTLAELRRLQGRPQEALALELEYLEQAELPEEVRHARRGWVLEFGGQPQNALAEYRLAYRHLVEVAQTAKRGPTAETRETGLTAEERLRIALLEPPPTLSGEPIWNDYFELLDRLFRETGLASSRAWMEDAVDSSELAPLARSLLCERLGRQEQARVLARLALEQGFAALRAADPLTPREDPFDALIPLAAQPRGEFVIFCTDLGPVDRVGLLRAIWAHSYRARITDADPGFRGYRDGQVAVELEYLPDATREVQGSLLLGESRVGQALLYGGSLARYLEKHKAEWPDGADLDTVMRNAATYAAKHEILVHHSGNFLLRGFRQDYRGNIRGDAYAEDGYLESNHPNDILWNLPELVSPRHPFRSLQFPAESEESEGSRSHPEFLWDGSRGETPYELR